MIRLTFLLRRKPEMTRLEFQKYWREEHGPLVAGKAHVLNIHRYLQVHTLEPDYGKELAGARGVMEDPYDGVEEVWWNSREDLVKAMKTSKGKSALRELLANEKQFIHLAHSPPWFAYEYPQVNPAPEDILATENNATVKLYFIFRPPKTLSLEKAQLYWRTAHGPLIRRIAESGHIKRYLQVHRYEEPLEEEWRKSRGTTTETYAGHAELWYNWRDLLVPVNSPERIRGVELAIKDESKFIDFKRSSMWLAKELVFVDKR